jgi:hypothetical protein
MSNRPRAALCLLVAACAVPVARAEGALGFWSPRDLEGMTKRRWEAALNRTQKEILELNRTLTTWPQACEVVEGAKEYAANTEFLAQLADQITDSTLTRLDETYRLIQWERVVAGDLVFPGRGFVVYDDVFTVAGRANWILRTITDKNFGLVKPKTTADELEALKRAWKSHLAGGQPPEYRPPFRSEVGGNEELHDLVAVEALIRSLAPSAAKQAQIRACLDKVGAAELPSDPDHPASLCNPDQYVWMFLRQIMDVDPERSADAWLAWWTENKDRLRFNPKTGKFESQLASAAAD